MNAAMEEYGSDQIQEVQVTDGMLKWMVCETEPTIKGIARTMSKAGREVFYTAVATLRSNTSPGAVDRD